MPPPTTNGFRYYPLRGRRAASHAASPPSHPASRLSLLWPIPHRNNFGSSAAPPECRSDFALGCDGAGTAAHLNLLLRRKGGPMCAFQYDHVHLRSPEPSESARYDGKL